MKRACRRIGVSVFLTLVMAFVAHGQNPVGIGVVGYHSPVLCAEISPTGFRLGFIEGTRLRTVGLRDDGYVNYPGSPTELELPGIVQMKFSPNGQDIICPDAHGQVHLVARSDWSVRTVEAYHGELPIAMDAIDSPRLAFIQYCDTGRTNVVDYREGELFDSLEQWSGAFAGPWHARDICVTPDGHTIYRVYSRGDPEECSVVEALDFPHGTRPLRATHLWDATTGPLAACCLGPDDDHIMGMTRDSGQLYIIRRSDGHIYPRVNLPIQAAADLDFSQDGNWAVVTALNPLRLYVLAGADLRALVAPGSQMDPNSVRRGDVRLLERPRACCLHPTMNVAYVYSAVRPCVRVFELHVPGVG